MSTCPSCHKEIAEGAVVCKYCGATLGVPARPKGVTVIAVLSFIGAFFGLISLPSFNTYNSVILGVGVPVLLAQIHTLIGISISLFCGFGFLKLKEMARKVYLYYGAWSILNGAIGIFVLPSLMKHMPQFRYARSADRELAVAIVVISGLIGIAVVGYIMYYLVRRKDYFVH